MLFKQTFESNVKNSPIIIFVEEELPWVNKIVDAVRKTTNVKCCKLENARDAMQFREQIKGQS
jgi:hypothetical protein